MTRNTITCNYCYNGSSKTHRIVLNFNKQETFDKIETLKNTQRKKYRIIKQSVFNILNIIHKFNVNEPVQIV